MTVKNYAGAAASTTLSSGIASGTTSIPVADGSTYPTANFNIVIDKGLAGEEKIFISSRSGNTLTVSARGADGTTAAAHSTGATVQHCAFGSDFQEANDHVNGTGTVHTGASISPGTLIIPGATSPAQTAEGSAVWDTDDDLLTVGTGAARKTMVDTSSTQTLAGKTLTTPTIADLTNANHAHDSTAHGGALAAAALASMVNSTFAATLSGSGYAIGNGSIACRYFQLGKLVFVHYLVTWGTTSTRGSGGPTLTLPVAADTTLQPVDASFRGFLGLHGAAKLTDSTSTTTPIAASLVTGGSTIDVIFYDTGSSPNLAAAAGNGNVFLNAQATGWFELAGWYIAA